MGQCKNTENPSNKQVKKTKVAETSRKCWREINQEGIPQMERPRVLKTVKELQPCTSRMIMYALNKERGNITRCLYDLIKTGTIKIAFTAKCQFSRRTVSYYSLIDWKGGSND